MVEILIRTAICFRWKKLSQPNDRDLSLPYPSSNNALIRREWTHLLVTEIAGSRFCGVRDSSARLKPWSWLSKAFYLAKTSSPPWVQTFWSKELRIVPKKTSRLSRPPESPKRCLWQRFKCTSNRRTKTDTPNGPLPRVQRVRNRLNDLSLQSARPIALTRVRNVYQWRRRRSSASTSSRDHPKLTQSLREGLVRSSSNNKWSQNQRIRVCSIKP